jgi:hypothetical protein
MSNYTQMSEIERKELLTKIAGIAHSSDEFLRKLVDLVEEYESENRQKIGFNND